MSGHPRLDNLAPILTIAGIAVFAAGVMLAIGLLLGVGLALVIVPLAGRIAGGVRWWGGVRCEGCGHTTMLR